MQCDKTRPFCGSCIRSSTCNSCHYENQPWDVATDIKRLNQQIIQLKQKNAELKNVISDYENQINELISERVAQSNHPSSLTNDSVSEAFRSASDGIKPRFSNSAKFKQVDEEDDLIHDLVKDFDVLVIKENKLLHFGSTSFMSLATNDPLISDVFGKFLACQKEIYEKFHSFNGPTDVTDSETALLSNSSNSSMSEIINPINSILPPKDVFHSLLNRFFEKCYIFMPYVDKITFYEQLKVVLRTTDHQDVYFIVPNRIHLITVATTLLFLRFAYLTLPFEKISDTGKNRNIDSLTMELYATGVHITPIFIEHCKNCIANASALKKANLQIVQALLFLKFYKLQSPEDGDGGIDSSISLSIVVQMAKMIGLNRDPEHFDIVDDVRKKHVWRKVWYKLLELDVHNSLNLGSPMMISDDDSFDTELPYVSAELQRSGPLDPAEAMIVKQIALSNQTVMLFRKISRIMMVIKSTPKRSEIDACVMELELLMDQKLRPFSDFVDIGVESKTSKFSLYERSDRAKECTLKLYATAIHHILCYVLMLTTIPENTKLRNIYSRKTIVSALSIFKFGWDYLKHPSFIFGDDLKRFVTPHLLFAVQRSFQLICILIVRHYESFGQVFSNLSEIPADIIAWLTSNKKEMAALAGVSVDDTTRIMSFQLYTYMEEVYQYGSKLSEEYFACWKFCKMITMFIVYLIEKHPIYKEFSNRLHAKRTGRMIETSNSNSSLSNGSTKETGDEFEKLLVEGRGGNAMSVFDNFVDSQLKQLDMYNETQGTNYWANLIDEAGQLKYDYLNPYFEEQPIDYDDIDDMNDYNEDLENGDNDDYNSGNSNDSNNDNATTTNNNTGSSSNNGGSKNSNNNISSNENSTNANQDSNNYHDTAATQTYLELLSKMGSTFPGNITGTDFTSFLNSTSFNSNNPTADFSSITGTNMDFSGYRASLGNLSNNSSNTTPNILSDIQSKNFLDNAFISGEIDRQFQSLVDPLATNTSSSNNNDSLNTGSSSSYFTESTGDANSTPAGSTGSINNNAKNNKDGASGTESHESTNNVNNKPSPSDVNYGMHVAKMMFGNM